MIKTKKSDLNNYHEDDDYGSGNYDFHEETFGHKHHFLDGMRKSLGIHKHYRSTAEGRKGKLHKKVTVSFWIFGFVFNLEYLSQFFLKFKNHGQSQNPHD